MSRPVLFLDFDGVLNTNGSRREHGMERIDPERVERVNRIVERTGCAVVVSSTWRLLFGPNRRTAMNEILAKAGSRFPVESVTPKGHQGMGRGVEIQMWINEWDRFEVGPIAAVDDEADMNHLEHRCVRTNDTDGLEDEHVERLVALLTEAQP